jgi:hypothetical protein
LVLSLDRLWGAQPYIAHYATLLTMTSTNVFQIEVPPKVTKVIKHFGLEDPIRVLKFADVVVISIWVEQLKRNDTPDVETSDTTMGFKFVSDFDNSEYGMILYQEDGDMRMLDVDVVEYAAGWSKYATTS